VPELCLIEEAQGQYSYQDAEDSYSGRFILFSCQDKLAIDLFAFYFPAASIRHNKDSTLLYLPINNEVLILGPDDNLPLQGWELPIAPLAAAYKGTLPDNPDSTEIGDTLILWKQGIGYLQLRDTSRAVILRKVIALRGEGWELRREGQVEGASDRARRIVFKQENAELILEFTDIKFVEKEPAKVFPLNLSDGVKRLDYR
jgi:hypothetical protein